MRIPITKYGLWEVVVYPLAIIAAMGTALGMRGFVSPDWAVWVVEAVLLVVLIWVLSFFRDPNRKVPTEKNILISPADGVITDIETVENSDIADGAVLKIGIFLNIFNVHINRTPCAVRIEKITYKPGKFLNAMNAESAKVNESNDVLMTRLDEPCSKVLVRQISGAIARRIVCRAETGQEFAGGQRFGMIKFGSRTELHIAAEGWQCLVKPGDKVKAGLTKILIIEN